MTADQSGEQLNTTACKCQNKGLVWHHPRGVCTKNLCFGSCYAEQQDGCPPQLDISFAHVFLKPSLPFQANCAPQKTPHTRWLEHSVHGKMWSIAHELPGNNLCTHGSQEKPRVNL